MQATIDLKDAYFSQVPIFQPHRKYLRFLCNFKCYKFTCLLFGNSLAPRVFTKIFKSDGQEISTIEWQELKNRLPSFFVHK